MSSLKNDIDYFLVKSRTLWRFGEKNDRIEENESVEVKWDSFKILKFLQMSDQFSANAETKQLIFIVVIKDKSTTFVQRK